MSGLSSDTRRLVSIFRSSKKNEMYLYVDKKKDLAELPEALMAHFGRPEPVFDLLLTPGKTLARADAAEVLRKISEQGFYLQMPPAGDDYMMEVVKAQASNPAVGRRNDGQD